ncbi:GTP-binding protein, partial [Staphylococcus hominis]
IELIMACQDPRIVQFVERPHVVSIVDAFRFLQRQQYTDSTKRLMEEQLEVSDVLVVNKLDLITVEDRDTLKKQLNEVNKYSSKIYTTYGQVN